MYSATSETSVQFEFMVASRPTAEPAEVQCKVMSKGVPRPFQLFTSSMTINSFQIVTAPDSGIDTLTISGELLSTIVLGEGPDSKHFMEIAPFTVVAVDVKTPRGDGDSFALTITYSGTQETGPQLEELGFGNCDSSTATCEVTFEGTLDTGDIVLHGSSGD
jgi:hypothetical protein